MRLLVCKVAGYRYFDLQAIYARFPKDYRRFHDICGGSGAILLSKEHDVEFECLNDYNLHFFHLYNTIKFTPETFHISVNVPGTVNSFFQFKCHTGIGTARGIPRREVDRYDDGVPVLSSTWYACCIDNFILRNLSVNGNCEQYSPVAGSFYHERLKSIHLISKRLQKVKLDAIQASLYLEQPLTQDDFVIVDIPTRDTLARDFQMSKRTYQETIGACLMSDAKIMLIHEQPEELLKDWSTSVERNFLITTNY